MKKDLTNAFGDLTVIEDRSARFLLNALAENDLPGFDYLEFKVSLSALASMNMEENVAFKSAYATAATMGLTKEKLLSSAGHYQKVLGTEKEKFDTALQNNMTRSIAAKQERIRELRTAIEQKAERIKQLTNEIEVHKKEADKAQETIDNAQGKIESTKNNFENALAHFNVQIESDVDKIKNYL